MIGLVKGTFGKEKFSCEVIFEFSTFDKEEFYTALAEIMTTDVDHELHVRVPVARRLASWTHRIHLQSETILFQQ